MEGETNNIGDKFLKNLKEEFRTFLQFPEGWKWIKSNELFSFVTSGARAWAKYYADEGAIFIRITNLNFDTLELDIRPEKNQYVNPPNGLERTRTNHLSALP